MKPFSTLRIFLALLFSSALLPYRSDAQYKDPSHRFQYRKLRWEYFNTVSYHLYFPKGYDSLASFASVHLPDIASKIKADVGLHLREAPTLIIYPSLVQAYESNIGSTSAEPQPFPTVYLQGQRSVLTFNGSYEDFRRQLSEVWLRLCLQQQFKSVLEASDGVPLRVMPDWFEKGLIHYATLGWTIGDEAKVCAVWNGVSDTARAFSELIEMDPTLSGAAFCYFISHRYRRDALRQLLVLLGQRKSFSSALRLITKRNEDVLFAACFDFYNQRLPLSCSATNLSPEEQALKALLQDRHASLHAHSVNSRQTYTALVTEKDHTREMYIVKTSSLIEEDYKWKLALKYKLPPWHLGHENDPYPLMQWSDDGQQLAIVLPQKGKLRLLLFDTQGKRLSERVLYGVDHVQSIVANGPKGWIMSATRHGRSDIVQYDMQTLRFKPLSSGHAEHINIGRDPLTQELFYRSGYPADSLYHPDTLAKPYGLYSLSNEEEAIWRKDSAWIRWERGVRQGRDLVVDRHSPKGFHRVDNLLDLIHNKIEETEVAPWLQEYRLRLQYDDSVRQLLRNAASDEPSLLKGILRPGYSENAAASQRDSLRRSLAYTARNKRPYLLQLHQTYFSAQVNNDYFINRYQPYAAYLGTFKFPELGAMMRGGFSDLFENHQVSMGYRMPSGTEGSDFFTRYRNVAGRLNWHLLYFRKVERLQPDGLRDWKDPNGHQLPAAAKVKTHYGELGFDYPLSYRTAIGFSTALRRDQTIFLATDRYSLQFNSLNHWWSINALSFATNQLHNDLPLLYRGWEARTSLDGMLATGKNEAMLYGVYGRMALHQPLYRHINLVTTVQAGYSGGTQKILYTFGGIDNNLVPATDTSVRFPQHAPYAFQTLVTPLRAWRQNSLYGTYFGMLNLDLYLPLFHTLIPLHTGFKVVKNFQVGFFADVAAAGGQAGLVPVKGPKYAWGYSFRTQLAGYGLRFDMGWPVSWQEKPIWSLSLLR